MALHTVGPWFLGKCLEQQILSDGVDYCCFQWEIFLTLNSAWAWTFRCA